MSEPQRRIGEAVGYGIPRALILRGRDDFARLFADGRSVRSGSLVLKYRVAGPDEPAVTEPSVIAAFIVPKRHGRAVDRNRARRLIRENWRRERPAFLASLDDPMRIHLGLIWAGPTAATRCPTYDEIGADLRKGLVRLRKRLGTEVIGITGPTPSDR